MVKLQRATMRRVSIARVILEIGGNDKKGQSSISSEAARDVEKNKFEL
jgi:hypothetical protein